MANKYDKILGKYREADSAAETDPLSLHLNQSSPQTFTGGGVAGSGILGVTAGQLGLDTTLASTTHGSEGARLIGYTEDETVYDMIDFYANRGVLEGCEITDAGGLNITWVAGDLFDRVTGNIIETIAGSETCTDNAINYLKWISGTGLTLGTTAPTGDQIYVGRIDTFAGDIHIVRETPHMDEQVANNRRALRAMFPLVVTDGLLISEKSGGGAWDVICSAGTYFSEGNTPKDVAQLDSTVSPYIARIYRSSGVWTMDSNASIDPTQWNNGTNLVATTALKYYKSLFLIGHDRIHWIYPQAEYDTIAQAIAAPLPTIPAGLQMHPTVTAVVLKGNATAFPTAGGQEWQDVRPRLSGTVQPTTISDHGSLAGLSDDDHTQYALLAGRVGGQTLIGGTAVTDILKLQGTSGNGTLTSPAIQLLTGNNGGTVAVTVLNNGNVGIGTSPSYPFHVESASAGTIGYFKNTQAWTGTQYDLYVNRYAYMGGFRINGADGRRALYLGTNGILGFGTNGGTITFENVINQEMMRITSAGYVGINTNSPSGKLDVHGAGTTTGVTFQTADSGGNAKFTVLDNGVMTGVSLALSGGFGCNGAAIQTAYASGGALNAYVTGAFGLDSDANMSALHAMVVKMRAALVANGIMS